MTYKYTITDFRNCATNGNESVTFYKTPHDIENFMNQVFQSTTYHGLCKDISLDDRIHLAAGNPIMVPLAIVTKHALREQYMKINESLIDRDLYELLTHGIEEPCYINPAYRKFSIGS